MMRVSAKMHRTTFIDLDILPTNDNIARFKPNDLDLLFQGKNMKC